MSDSGATLIINVAWRPRPPPPTKQDMQHSVDLVDEWSAEELHLSRSRKRSWTSKTSTKFIFSCV